MDKLKVINATRTFSIKLHKQQHVLQKVIQRYKQLVEKTYSA